MAAARILHLGPLYNFHLRRWAELTREAGFEPHVAGHVIRGAAPVPLDDVAASVHQAPAAPTPFLTATLVPWGRMLARRLSPAVVHAHFLPDWGFFAAAGGCRPLVISAWGSDVYLLRGARRRLAAFGVRRADRLIAASPHIARELVAWGADPDRCEHVDLGVDLETFRPSAEGAARARRELGLAEGPVVLSFRGGHPAYNLTTVAEAFGLLHERAPDAQLVMAHGRAPLRADTLAAVARLEAAGAPVKVMEDVPPERMPALYRAATVGVSIPFSDGSPRSVWEGLACGLPMVVSDLPQIRERVEGNAAVRLVPPRADAVAEALAEAVARPGAESDAAREWAVQNVDHRDHVERLRRVYESLSAGRSPRRSEAASEPLRSS